MGGRSYGLVGLARLEAPDGMGGVITTTSSGIAKCGVIPSGALRKVFAVERLKKPDVVCRCVSDRPRGAGFVFTLAYSTGVNDITGESRVFTDDAGGSPVLLLQGG